MLDTCGHEARRERVYKVATVKELGVRSRRGRGRVSNLKKKGEGKRAL